MNVPVHAPPEVHIRQLHIWCTKHDRHCLLTHHMSTLTRRLQEWVLPEQHSTVKGVLNKQLDWISLSCDCALTVRCRIHTQVWVSPEQHGTITGVFKNQIDWIPLSLGSVRPTQGRVVAIAQVR